MENKTWSAYKYCWRVPSCRQLAWDSSGAHAVGRQGLWSVCQRGPEHSASQRLVSSTLAHSLGLTVTLRPRHRGRPQKQCELAPPHPCPQHLGVSHRHPLPWPTAFRGT